MNREVCNKCHHDILYANCVTCKGINICRHKKRKANHRTPIKGTNTKSKPK